MRLPAPVFEGDTIYSESEVLEVRESRSRPEVGIVRVRTTGSNQDGVVVITFTRTLLVYRRGHGPGGTGPGRARAAERPGPGRPRGGRPVIFSAGPSGGAP